MAGGQASVFYFDSKHELALNGQELPQNIKNTPHGITTFSAGLDAIGSADVFVQASDKSIWKWNEGDWTKVLGPANGVKSFAAVDGDRAYAIYSTGTAQFDGSVWSKVPGSTTVTAIDAITDGRGNDAVFALNTNGTFGEYFGGHFDQMMPANPRLGNFAVHIGTFRRRHRPVRRRDRLRFVDWPRGRFNINLGVYRIGYGSETFITSGQAQFSGANGNCGSPPLPANWRSTTPPASTASPVMPTAPFRSVPPAPTTFSMSRAGSSRKRPWAPTADSRGSPPSMTTATSPNDRDATPEAPR